MLLNLTNHPVRHWSAEQLRCAIQRWGTVRDLPFPQVDPLWKEREILQTAHHLVRTVHKLHPDAVLCQGELTLTLTVVSLLQRSGIPVYAATSNRQVTELSQPDGSLQKRVVYRFVSFRRYPSS